MRITQEDLDRIDKRLDEFYGDGALKSTNKSYLNPQNDKQRKRNKNALLARQPIGQFRKDNDASAAGFFTLTDLHKGELLIKDGITAGRCLEMQQVAAFLAMSDSELAPKVTQLWGANTENTDRGDHAFLIMTDAGLKLSQLHSSSIADLAATPKTDGVWIIDRWMKIKCHAGEYKRQLEEKLLGYDDPTTEKNQGTVKVLMGGKGIGSDIVKDADGTEYLRPMAVVEDDKGNVREVKDGQLPTAKKWGEAIISARLSASVRISIAQRRLLDGRSAREGQRSAYAAESSDRNAQNVRRTPNRGI